MERSELRERRLKKGLTQTEVAERAGIGQSHYSKIEAGEKTPSLTVAIALAEIVGGTVAKLFREGEEEGDEQDGC